ncbi:Hippocampus abundant transcript 1 protein [Linnemannia zychae]|nr:Hippocampus abundant transcript 1 protein [Linnemannia zychae]
MVSTLANDGRPTTVQDTTEDITEEREDSPLLSESSSSSNNETLEDNVDRTSIYAQILRDNLPWYKRPSALWLFPIYGIVAVSMGMLTSSLGQFEAGMLCREYFNRHPPSNSTIPAGLSSILAETSASSPTLLMMGPHPPECQGPEVQAFTIKSLAVMQVLGGICGTLSLGYWASLSDKHGRIKLLLLGTVSNLITLSILLVMGKWWDQIGFPSLYVMATISGLLGGMGLNAAMSLAYAADCTPTNERSLIFSRLHAVLFFGLALGPYLGGKLTKAAGFTTLIHVCFVNTLITGSFLLFVIPESLPSKQSEHIYRLYEKAIGPKATQTAAANKQAQQNVAWHSHFIRSMRFFKPNGHNTNFIILSAISFLQTLALNGTFTVIILYTNLMFDWGEEEDGILFSLGSSVRLISLLILLPLIVHGFHKWNEKKRASGPKAHKGPAKDISNDITPSHPWADNLDRDDTNSDYSRNETIIGDHPDRILIEVNDPSVAASIEHLGEAALNLSDDEEPFHERRRRKSIINPKASHTAKQNTKPLLTSNYSSTSSPSTSSAAASTSQNSTSSQSSQKIRDTLKLDTWIIRLGFIINSSTYIGYGLATKPWQFYVWSSLHAVSIISMPSLKSLITSQVEPSQFGAVLGAVQVLDSMSGILSPMVISWVYALTVGTRPEFVWYTCAALTGACSVLAFMIRQRQFGRGPSSA